MYKFFFFAMLVVLSGCISKPETSQLISINKNRLHDKSLFEPDGPRTIPVTITRDVGIKGAMESAYLKIDGHYIVWFNVAETITIYLEPDGYIFELVDAGCPDYSYCLSNSLDVTIKKGLLNKFRITVDDGFKLKRDSA